MACNTIGSLKITNSIGRKRIAIVGTLVVGISAFPLSQPKPTTIQVSCKGIVYHRFSVVENSCYPRIGFLGLISRKMASKIPRCSSSSNSDNAKDESSAKSKAPFGYTRKDVLLIGLGVTFLGIGLKSGLEYFGVDPLQAGNVVQLLLVLGLTVGWISTYIFRVSNKEMTYAQQLRDYESKVMEKRLEGLTEAELEALLEQVEEEKQRLASELDVPGNDYHVDVDKELGGHLAVQIQLPSPVTPAGSKVSATGNKCKLSGGSSAGTSRKHKRKKEKKAKRKGKGPRK